MRPVFIFVLYRMLLVAAAPFIAAYVVYRSLQDRRYISSIRERLGGSSVVNNRTMPGGIWLHAVSVGEILSSIHLIGRIRTELRAPVHVSVSTLAGYAVAKEKLGGLADSVFFAPFDYVWVVRRVLRRIRPSTVVVMETEIWPNFYREAKRSGCSLLIVNGRISTRTVRSYLRWRWFFGAVLSLPDRILAQSKGDAARYLAVGAPAGRLVEAGNLKYDFDPRTTSIAPDIRAFLERRGDRKIWIAASTMPPASPGDVDEDDAVIEAFRQLENVLLILVPRKPERFDLAAEKLSTAGIPFVRRSMVKGETAPVLLLDSMGELGGLFAVADVVFMGGTLAQRGGHNILEPAFFGVPVVVGPHMENFGEISSAFREAQACVPIGSAGELAPAVEELVSDPVRRNDIGRRAKACAEGQRGATALALSAIRELHDLAVPEIPRALPSRLILKPLSWIWAAGSRWQQRRARQQSVRLSTPVLSVGGLAMGGTGKTPMVRFLARKLSERGRKPAILTRGYKRQNASQRSLILERGATAPVADTGDEPQILLRSGYAHLGIGADRVAVARQMEERFHPDVFLLDDGFQHGRLQRDVDIVLIDALDPFGGGVFPAGTLREPATALARASILVITRAEPGRAYAGLRRRLAEVNPAAPVFTSRVQAKNWVRFADSETACPAAFEGKRVVAFCGLGNPSAFRQTLRDLSVTPEDWMVFPDHHRYSRADLDRIAIAATASGAEAIVTTEKDAVKLPEAGAGRMPIWFLAIDVTVEREAEFLSRALMCVG